MSKDDVGLLRTDPILNRPKPGLRSRVAIKEAREIALQSLHQAEKERMADCHREEISDELATLKEDLASESRWAKQYQAEADTLRALAREATEVVRKIPTELWRTFFKGNTPYVNCIMCNAVWNVGEDFKHLPTCLAAEAAALLPRLEAAGKEKPS